MEINFYKYQGTGNDFVILDNRDGIYSTLTEDQVRFLCDRKFGIGADGLMLLETLEGFDFKIGEELFDIAVREFATFDTGRRADAFNRGDTPERRETTVGSWP